MTDLRELSALHARFRALMNGVLSRSLRAKGLSYRVAFGVEQPRLQALAEEVRSEVCAKAEAEGRNPADALYDLAAALWKEDIRESRLLAPLLMPPSRFSQELAEVWIEQIRYGEEATSCCAHLFSQLAEAPLAAFAWIAREEKWFQVCGYQTLATLLRQGAQFNVRAEEELLDQAAAALGDERYAVRKAAHTALLRFASTSLRAERRVASLLNSMGM